MYATIVALLVAMFTLPTTMYAQTQYDITIAGVRVTPANCNDLSVIDGVSGTVKYDPTTRVLTLQDAVIKVSGEKEGIYSRQRLTIFVIGTNRITAGGFSALKAEDHDVTITGGGKLFLSGRDFGLYVTKKSSATIDNCEIECDGSFGDTNHNNAFVTINNATITAKGKRYESVRGIENLTLNRCTITEPAGAVYDPKVRGIALNGKLVPGKVVIKATSPIEYGITIAGVRVTPANCNDLSVIDGVSGTVKYDPAYRVLTLQNAVINVSEEEDGIFSTVEGLTISVIGTNRITAGGFSALTTKETQNTIKGGGKLVLSGSEFGLYAMSGGSVTIENCEIDCDGSFGTINHNNAFVTINNATITAEGKRYEAVRGIQNLILKRCTITEPAGAVYDPKVHGIALNGKLVPGKVVIKATSPIEYGLTIAGVEVTSANCNDLSVIDGVSGTVEYNPVYRVLTLQNAVIKVSGEKDGIFSTVDGLTISVIGTNSVIGANSITASGFSAIRTDQTHTTIKGGGKLVLSGSEFGLYAMWKSSVTIDNCEIDCDGSFGTINHNNAHVTINNATITAKSKSYAAVRGIEKLTLNRCTITEPAGAVYDPKLCGIALNGQLVTGKVVIKATSPIEYGLRICGVEVTSANYNNLSKIGGVSGTVKYAPAYRVLTLQNATIISNTANAIFSNIDGLMIKVIGTSNLATEYNTALSFRQPLTIMGGGVLNLKSGIDCAIFANQTNLTIENCTVNAESVAYGIAGKNGRNEIFTIRNATVTAIGTGKGSICNFAKLKLKGCRITEPSGARFSSAKHAVVLKGDIVKSKVVITDPTAIETPTADTTATTRGTYTISGVRMSGEQEDLPKGVYIVNGKKVVKP